MLRKPSKRAPFEIANLLSPFRMRHLDTWAILQPILIGNLKMATKMLVVASGQPIIDWRLRLKLTHIAYL